ncbi:MAG: UvrD-helicase domain-containing protein [Elusimicrobia bacterium]|nr:UvrD-helicase domain-containing protein [Elusimicrobiota bacterium]
MKKLNPEQKKAVETIDGPVLVFAGAGSGKTMVITHRIAELINKGISPYEILAVTFTNKAAQEMRDRVIKLIGSRGTSVWVSTFHSLASRILRDESEKDFTIYDEHDQTVVIKECLERLDIDPKRFPPSKIREIISNAKNNLMDAESYSINATAHSDAARYNMSRVYAMYQDLLKANGGYDFADLLVETIRLFKDKPDILEKYRRRFRYIMVDEYQDTNYAQYMLIKLLSPPQNNICVVGDDDQCLVRGTKIKTEDGYKEIEKLQNGTKVAAASGWGKYREEEPDRISKRKYKGKVVQIVTKTGKRIKVTPNHMLFGRLQPRMGLYYVYLMQKKSMGFRMGITQGVRSKRKSNNCVSGLMVRINQENGDKLWIIKTCKTHKEAVYYEQYYSFQYGIPTYTFHSRGRKLTLDEQGIRNLFKSIDTVSRAEKLMRDMLIDPLFPHFVAGGYVNGHIDRKIINFTMFGENRCGGMRPWHAHRIQLNTSDNRLKKKIAGKGFSVRLGKKDTWRVETSRKDYSEAKRYITGLSSAADIDVVKKARLTPGKSFVFLPASQIQQGMLVPVFNGNRIVEEEVNKVSLADYEGYVYDVSMPDLRNYIADNFVVHNSVYSWRGANVRNILEFKNHFREATMLKLEQNYRSTKNILDAAHNVIKNNPSRSDKKLWTSREGGEIVRKQEFLTSREEALAVVSEIRRLVQEGEYNLGDMAVFYRVNAQSRAFEDVLRAMGMNYRVVGGVKFYSRKEIKDIIAYMRVLVNPFDDVSMERVINNPPRGIGKKTMSALKSISVRESSSVYKIVTEGHKDIPASVEKKIKPLRDLLARLKETLEKDDASLLAKEIIELSGYHHMLEDDEDLQARTRLENIEELVSAFAEDVNARKTVKEILNEITLITEVDKWQQDEEYVTLMTIHIAKGLEFPVVFLTGLEEELFPHYDALNDPEQMEEERRLCYVGMTRAKDLLYLTSASQRMLYGQSRWHIPSRFIKEALGDGSGENEYKYD